MAACHYAPSCIVPACRSNSPNPGSKWLLVYGPACLWASLQQVSAFEAQLHFLEMVQDCNNTLETLTESGRLKSKTQRPGPFTLADARRPMLQGSALPYSWLLVFVNLGISSAQPLAHASANLFIYADAERLADQLLPNAPSLAKRHAHLLGASQCTKAALGSRMLGCPSPVQQPQPQALRHLLLQAPARASAAHTAGTYPQSRPRTNPGQSNWGLGSHARPLAGARASLRVGSSDGERLAAQLRAVHGGHSRARAVGGRKGDDAVALVRAQARALHLMLSQNIAGLYAQCLSAAHMMRCMRCGTAPCCAVLPTEFAARTQLHHPLNNVHLQ